jgi:ABC-2 type transport system ATP-binding protein
LFLDEPTTGLDPPSRLSLWSAIRNLVQTGSTLLLTTQYLEEADALADVIAVVDKGRVIARGTAGELKSKVGGEWVEMVVHDATDLVRAREVVSRHSSAEATVEGRARRLRAPTDGGTRKLTGMLRALDDAGIELDDVGLHRPTLDDVFLSLTGHTTERAAAGDEDDGDGDTSASAGRAS